MYLLTHRCFYYWSLLLLVLLPHWVHYSLMWMIFNNPAYIFTNPLTHIHTYMHTYTCNLNLRNEQRDDYLVQFFYPKSVRSAYIVLKAFQLEVLTIPQIITQPSAGAIRLQWWRDTISSIYSYTPTPTHPYPVHQQPVAHVLPYIVKKYKLSQFWFDGILNALVCICMFTCMDGCLSWKPPSFSIC